MRVGISWDVIQYTGVDSFCPILKINRSSPVIDDPLVPLPRNPLHGTEGVQLRRTENSGTSLIGREFRYAQYARIAIRVIGRHPK